MNRSTFKSACSLFTLLFCSQFACKGQTPVSSTPRQIVGDDNRIDVTNQALISAVGKLAQDNSAFCNAFRVSEEKIITARHCIVDKDVDQLKFLTSNSSSRILSLESSYADSDVAMLTTEKSTMPGLPIAKQPESFRAGQLVGFDLKADKLKTDSTGRISDTDWPGVLHHSFDTIPGSSGSPIINSSGEVIAVHLGADNLTGDPLNYGVWINRTTEAKVPSTLSEQENIETVAIIIAKYLIDRYVGPQIEKSIDRFTDWVIESLKKLISKDTTKPAAIKINEGLGESLPERSERQLTERRDGRWCAGSLCAESDGRSLNYRERFAFGLVMMASEIFEKTNGRKPSAEELRLLSEKVVSGGAPSTISVISGYRDGDTYFNSDSTSCEGNDRKISVQCGGIQGDRMCTAKCARQVPVRENIQVNSGLTHDQIIIAAREMNRWANGQFRRAANDPKVYMTFHNGASICLVQNPDHLRALGADNKVIVAPSGTNLLSGKNYTGTCGWPNGMFRRSNQPEVYRMYDDSKFCHVGNEAQLATFGGWSFVMVVSPDSDIGRGRTATGSCR